MKKISEDRLIRIVGIMLIILHVIMIAWPFVHFFNSKSK